MTSNPIVRERTRMTSNPIVRERTRMTSNPNELTIENSVLILIDTSRGSPFPYVRSIPVSC
jgi:hypothetical protein